MHARAPILRRVQLKGRSLTSLDCYCSVKSIFGVFGRCCKPTASIQPAACCCLWSAGGQRAYGTAGLGRRGVRPPRSEVPGSSSGVRPCALSPRDCGAACSCRSPSLWGHPGERRSAVRGLGWRGAGAACGLGSSSASPGGAGLDFGARCCCQSRELTLFS